MTVQNNQPTQEPIDTPEMLESTMDREQHELIGKSTIQRILEIFKA